MVKPDSIALIGAGRMGSALAEGWLRTKDRPALSVIDPHPSERVLGWERAAIATINPEPHDVDVVVVAVKPQMFGDVVEEIRAWISSKTLVISIMAAVKLHTLQDRLGAQRVARAMPNTPGSVGQGVTLLCVPPGLVGGEVTAARQLLQPLGSVEGPMTEDDLVAATTVSGCGPAYVYLLAEVMAEAGIAQGLDPDLAMRIAKQTVIGGASLMEASGEPPAALREAVTSPGGVTKAALDVLMQPEAMPSLFEKALKAAAARDRELSEES